VLRTPAFESDEIARERVTLLEEAVQTADDMVRRPMQLALRGAFGDAGYGLPLHGLPESVSGLTDAMVRAWHADELAAGRSVCVAVGDLDPPRLAEHLAGIFESTPASEELPHAAPTAWQAQGSRAVEQRAKRQTALALVFPGPSRLMPGRFAGEVWSAVASGLGGRLFSVLREQRSLAYTVFASSWQRRGAGALLLYLATSPARESEAREALLAELAHFHEAPTDASEVARAVSYLSGQIPVERQTAGALAAELADAWLVGTGLDELLDPAAGYRAVTPTALRELAANAFDPSRSAEGIVRGR
jgi:zinc protease